MSDYAGVIGNVATIVGAATGQVWLQAAGMALSAWGASQQVLPGPKIGDVQRQTSQEGGFRPIVYGRSHPIAGNIIADGGPVIVTRRERQGKGGPKVESESAYRTYAVGVCEGEASLLQAWRNGILVYDAEDGSMAAENAAFLEYATWYTGSFDQPASPDLEEIYGAGQAPFFRGTAYLSIHNEDVTDQRGAWSQWQFRVFRGAARSYTTPPYPVYAKDNLVSSSQFGSGGYFGSTKDHLAVSVSPMGGEIRSTVIELDFVPIDRLACQLAPIGGEIEGAGGPVELDFVPTDNITVSVTPVGGEMKNVVVRYSNYEPELMRADLRPLGGEIT